MTITYQDYSTAVEVWHTYPHKDPGKAFMDYLGIDHYHSHTTGFDMPEDAAHRLKMLHSPHAMTIIKMYYINRGRTKEEREFDDKDRKLHH